MEETARKSFEWLMRAPEGILCSGRGKSASVSVFKRSGQIQLIFFAGASTEVQSRFDPARPLDLLAGYTQAMMQTLLWHPEPARVHVLGLGGARIPMVLHHYFPSLIIECTEIDADVHALACEYFELPMDERMQVFIEDGRAYLERTQAQYDILFIDAFSGVGFSPLRFASREFYALCKRRLASGGIVSVNLLPDDPLLKEKVNTLQASFEHCYMLEERGTLVLFAHDGKAPSSEQRLQRAQMLQGKHRFVFPFYERASAVKQLTKPRWRLPRLGLTHLRDNSTHKLPVSSKILNASDTQDPCACGSGKAYGACHGN